MLLLALLYVGKFGSRVPFFDDWALVPGLIGAQPLSPAYLWEPFNNHRLPLPKLVLYVLGRFSGFDFRAGMFLNVLLLAGLSLAMLRTVRRLRGGLHFADAFIPLVVLSLAQWECFLLGSILNHVGATVVAGAFLVLLAGTAPRVTPGHAVAMGLCLVLLPLWGSNGLILVPALALWLAFVGVRHSRAADPAIRRRGWLILGLVAATLLLSGLYFIDWHHLIQGSSTPTPAQILAHARQVLGMLLGASALPWAPLKTAVVPLALLAGGGLWLAAWLRRPQERVVLLGLLAFLLAMGCLVAAIAWGRRDYLGQTPFVPRYATLMLPLGCWLYLLWARYGGARVGPAAQMGLFLLAAVVFAPNFQAAFADGRLRRTALRDFESDLCRRLPPAFLAERGAGRVFQAEQQQDVAHYIRLLRDHHVGAFARLPEDLPLRVVELPPSAVSLRDMLWAGGVARPVGPDPSLKVALRRPRFICGVRLRYAYTSNRADADCFELSWQKGDRVSRAAGGSKVLLQAGAGAGERTALVWINDRIDGFRLVPRSKMFALRLGTVELLVPQAGMDPAASLSRWAAPEAAGPAPW
jgi:hypothetical protein